MNTPKKGITVRLNEAELTRLETLADRYRVPAAQVIRWAIAALDEHVNRRDGKLTLPVDFTEILNAPPAQSLVAEPSPGEITSGKTSSSGPES